MDETDAADDMCGVLMAIFVSNILYLVVCQRVLLLMCTCVVRCDDSD